MLNVEGLGRELNPDLDLWSTAKPILEKWMREQVGFQALKNNIIKESEQWSKTLPLIPKLVFKILSQKGGQNENINNDTLSEILVEQKKTNFWLRFTPLLLFILIIVLYFLIFKL